MFRKGEAIAVTDGSYKDDKGTAAFCITDTKGEKGIYGMNLTPGDKDSQCSFRSEAGGIAGILIVCNLLERLYGIGHVTLIIGCEKKDAGIHTLEYNRLIKPTHNHNDLL